jgi:NAD(P)-dependent dehydrogenase (short-subunit alcohol dehydrogenase family)
MGELKGKVAVVTGGSRGMGAEIVRALAAQGANVVISSRKVADCAEFAGEIERSFGVKSLPVGCNVSDWGQCDELVDATLAEFGKVDILVNNAGLSPLYDSLAEVSEALFDKTVAVNLKGPFRLMARFGDHMVTNGGGTIINIGSVEAIRPHPNALPYAAAKAGLHTLTEGFAQALAPSVRVNTVQPGPFLTDISKHWRPGVKERLEAQVALRRCAEPSEIVGAVMFFVTSASSYSTGALLRVDGGWR